MKERFWSAQIDSTDNDRFYVRLYSLVDGELTARTVLALDTIEECMIAIQDAVKNGIEVPE